MIKNVSYLQLKLSADPLKVCKILILRSFFSVERTTFDIGKVHQIGKNRNYFKPNLSMYLPQYIVIYSFLAKKSLTQSWRARNTPFELALCPASTKWEVVGISSFSSWATNSRANLSGHTSSPTPWTTQVLIGPVGPFFSFLTSSTKVSGSSNVPFKNRRVSKNDTEVACGKTVSEIWKISKWNGSYFHCEFSEQSTRLKLIVHVGLWQYWLWNFKIGYIKLDRFLP